MNSPDTYLLQTCIGLRENACPHVVSGEDDLASKLESAILSTKWPEFLKRQRGNHIRRHHQFTLSIAGCPNGCSRPHIADMGIILASRPLVSAWECTACGICTEACPDRGISMKNGAAFIDRSLCVQCGKCIQSCPTPALYEHQKGMRILVGGKLGRHPQLGREMPGLYSFDQAFHIVKHFLHLYMERYKPEKRFGEICHAEDGQLFSEL